MGTISNLSVSLTANTRGLQKGLNRARGHVKRFSKSVFNMKNTVLAAFGVGGIGMALKSATDAFKTQEQAEASLAAANKSMGRSTRSLTEDMIKLAAKIQKEGIIGDEAIIQGQSFLATFAQIPDSLLPRATRAMVDLMAKTGRSGQAAANMIGKASMGLTGSLSIAGVGLSDTTKKFAENLTKMKAEANKAGLKISFLGTESRLFKMILKDIESQIGGTNKALAETDSGALDQLGLSAGDLLEKFGKIVTVGISPFARQLSIDINDTTINVDSLALSFRNWLMDSVSGIGPLISAFQGIKLVIKSLKLIFLGFGLAVTGVLRQATMGISQIADVFGIDFGKEAFKFLDKSFDDQVRNVKALKQEMSTLTEDLMFRKTEGGLKDTLSGFFDRAKATQAGLDKPEINAPKNNLRMMDQLLLRQAKQVQQVTIDKAPQIDRTNTLLETLINKPNVAVAG